MDSALAPSACPPQAAGMLATGRVPSCESTSRNRLSNRLSFRSAVFISSITHGANIGHSFDLPSLPRVNLHDRHHCQATSNLQCQCTDVCNNEDVALGWWMAGLQPAKQYSGGRLRVSDGGPLA